MTLTAESESNTIQKLRAGDAAAFEHIIQRFAKPLLAYLRVFIPSRDLAEDALQETFEALWKSRMEIRAESGVKSWLYRVARNNALKILRRKSLEHENTSKLSAAVVTDELIKEEEQLVLLAALDKLSDEQREVIHLRFDEEMPFEEISSILEISLSAAKARYRHGIDRLKRIMEGER